MIVRITPAADADLFDIAYTIALDNPKASDRFLTLIDKKLRLLARVPEMGREREELADGLRSFPVGKYTIFYRSIPRGIEVIRVLHGARDIPSLF